MLAGLRLIKWVVLSQPGTHLDRFGVALGGGTARAFAHVGVLKVLADAGLSPGLLSGTSFGALIAAHYALYEDAEALWRWAETFPAREVWQQGLDFGLHRAALVEGGRVEGWLERTVFHGATFADLKLPLHITCTDVRTGELIVLHSGSQGAPGSYHGSIAQAVRASCALPGITRAFEVEGRLLIDGGFVSPVPVAPLVTETRFTLGVHTGIAVEKARAIRRFRTLHTSPFGQRWNQRFLGAPDHAYGTLLRGLARAGASYTKDPLQDLLELPDALLLRVDPPVAWWDLHRAAAGAEAGARAMRRALPEVQARLKAHETAERHVAESVL